MIPGGTEFAFSPDGKQIVSQQGNGIVFSDASSGKELDAIANVDNNVYRIALSADGKSLAVSGKEKVTIWDVDKTKEKGVADAIFRDIVVGLAFSPDGKTLATGSLDTRVVLWNVEKLPMPGR